MKELLFALLIIFFSVVLGAILIEVYDFCNLNRRSGDPYFTFEEFEKLYKKKSNNWILKESYPCFEYFDNKSSIEWKRIDINFKTFFDVLKYKKFYKEVEAKRKKAKIEQDYKIITSLSK